MKPLGLLRICDCMDCGGRQADKAAAREEEKRLIKKELEEYETQFLQGEPCPNCPDQGWYAVQVDEGEFEQVQCEFCYTVENSVFNLRSSHVLEV